jgi:Rrf2 family transcriptional regulator, cysteine metabolism repressor
MVAYSRSQSTITDLQILNPQPSTFNPQPFMKLSAKTEYACLAMLQLAGEYSSGEPLQIRRIADEHGIPSRFLVQILLQLKGASLVASTRGAAGGYRLAKPPSQITLAEVIEVMDGDERPETNAGKNTPIVASLLHLCRELDEIQRDRLAETTLSDVVEQAAQREPMWYI